MPQHEAAVCPTVDAMLMVRFKYYMNCCPGPQGVVFVIWTLLTGTSAFVRA